MLRDEHVRAQVQYLTGLCARACMSAQVQYLTGQPAMVLAKWGSFPKRNTRPYLQMLPGTPFVSTDLSETADNYMQGATMVSWTGALKKYQKKHRIPPAPLSYSPFQPLNLHTTRSSNACRWFRYMYHFNGRTAEIG